MNPQMDLKHALVSIVVLDFNGQRYWRDLVAALERQTFREFELLVVENGLSVSCPEVLHNRKVRVVQTQANLGFAGGVNFAWEMACGKFVVLLNNDALPEPDWLETLLSQASKDCSVAAVASKVLFAPGFVKIRIKSKTFVPAVSEGSDDFRSLGVRLKLPFGSVTPYLSKGLHMPEFESGECWVWTVGNAEVFYPCGDSEDLLTLEVASHPFLRGETLLIEKLNSEGSVTFASNVKLDGSVQHIALPICEIDRLELINNAGSCIDSDWRFREVGLNEVDRGQFDSTRELEIASACSLLIRRDCVDGKPFDPEFFAYCEDSDLTLSLRRVGWKIAYEPRSVVRHFRSGTSVSLSPFQVFYATRNWFWVVAKHAPWGIVWRVLSKDIWGLSRYGAALNEDYSLSRLKRETWFGFFKRLWRRVCDAD